MFKIGGGWAEELSTERDEKGILYPWNKHFYQAWAICLENQDRFMGRKYFLDPDHDAEFFRTQGTAPETKLEAIAKSEIIEQAKKKGFGELVED